MTEWPPADLERTDLGHGVSWSRMVDLEDRWVGIVEWHACVTGEVTAGGVYFEDAPPKWGGPRWQLVQASPLTIAPSILCRTCGLHGFIRDGKWVPA